MTWNFGVAFVAKPGLSYLVVQPAGSLPVLCEGYEWVTDAQSRFVGIKVRGLREQAAPAIMSLNSGTILTVISLISNLNTIFASLSERRSFAGSAPVGVEVHLTAKPRSAPLALLA